MALIPTGGEISNIGFWALLVVIIGVILGGYTLALHVLIGPLFDKREARKVEQQVRDRQRLGAVVQMSDRRG